MRRTQPVIVLLALLLASCARDTTPPAVQSVSPRDGASGIVLNTLIQITFSELMDENAVEASISIEPDFDCTVSWSGASIFLQPGQNLRPRTRYQVRIGAGACDRAGNPLGAEFLSSFTTGDSAASGVTVEMLGRSVMYGWFAHWQSDPWLPCPRGRFTLRYHEMHGPPDLVRTVSACVDSIPDDRHPVVFFKLCFVDFIGGDSLAARTNLTRNLDYVRSVYDTVVGRHGLRLIIGNALPQVAAHTDRYLVWNHRNYNDSLIRFAQTRSSVRVFDLYGVLSEARGTLVPDYAAAGDDSHLNETGYEALDAHFFSFLEQNY